MYESGTNRFPVYSQQNRDKMKVETIGERLLDICFHAYSVAFESDFSPPETAASKFQPIRPFLEVQRLQYLATNNSS
jgi:hypothetical protein